MFNCLFLSLKPENFTKLLNFLLFQENDRTTSKVIGMPASRTIGPDNCFALPTAIVINMFRFLQYYNATITRLCFYHRNVYLDLRKCSDCLLKHFGFVLQRPLI